MTTSELRQLVERREREWEEYRTTCINLIKEKYSDIDFNDSEFFRWTNSNDIAYMDNSYKFVYKSDGRRAWRDHTDVYHAVGISKIFHEEYSRMKDKGEMVYITEFRVYLISWETDFTWYHPHVTIKRFSKWTGRRVSRRSTMTIQTSTKGAYVNIDGKRVYLENNVEDW